MKKTQPIISKEWMTSKWGSFICSVVILSVVAILYIYNSDFRSELLMAFLLFLVVIVLVSLIISASINAIVPDRNVAEAHERFDADCCSECGRRNEILHSIEFHDYSFLLMVFVQSTRRGEFCVDCAYKLANQSFSKTACQSMFFPPVVLWAWFEKRSILKSIGVPKD